MTCVVPFGRIASTCIALPRRWKCGWKLVMRVFSLQHREAFRVRDLIRRNVERARAVLEAGEANQIAALLRLLAFRIEPDAEL